MAARRSLHDIDSEHAETDASLEASGGNSQIADDFEKSVKEEVMDRMQSQVDALTLEFNMRMEETMSGLDQRLREQHSRREAELRESAINVHAQNKALQVISRLLGKDWREVYPLLFPLQKDVWNEKMDMIAAQAPNKFSLQAFKMLILYKEEKGDGYRVENILDALNLSAKRDIIDEALKVLHYGGEEIYHPAAAESSRNGFHSKHKGRRSLERPDLPYHNLQSSTELPKVDEMDDPFSGPLANHRLLKFARKLGDKWKQLAKVLKTSEEDLQELFEYEDTVAAAFRMLYTWRDNAVGTPKEKLFVLMGALQQADCSEFVDSLVSGTGIGIQPTDSDTSDVQQASTAQKETHHEDKLEKEPLSDH